MESSESKNIASPPSSLPGSWEHDVFPSFHGPDVRKGFLSHIQKEFERKGITPFIDNKIKRGESIAPELKRAIQGSKIAIVLLSKNYASSWWCLDELVEIMSKVVGQTVLTIFYEVEPTDVKKQTGDFGKVFKETCQGKTEEKIEKWRKALESVAMIAGYHSRNCVHEAAMIENIATDISEMLNHLAPSPILDNLIGMEAHVKRMERLLRLDLDEVRMIGIWGPPGIGKSTIARFLFNQLSNSFQLRAIMVNIKESYPRPCRDEGSAQLQLQSQMLSQMINHKDIMITHLGVAQERMKDKKVFLVLDDVDRLAQLEALARKVQWFGPRSRIIITTEDLKLLKAHGINHIYKVVFPSDDEALQMFCMYAFDQKSPKDGFTKLSHEITYLVGSLPLGLKVMGSYFRGMSKEEWTRALSKLWSRLDGDIESILKFSYDVLCDEDKDLFLRIACFFNHEKAKKVEEHLANKFLDVRQGLNVLVEKSLISLVAPLHTPGWEKIEMHCLLAHMGKEIVRKQSDRDPGQRQFLVDDKDICEVLSDPISVSVAITLSLHCLLQLYRLFQSARSVVGIDFSSTKAGGELSISERAIERMSNLQFLKFRGGHRHPVEAFLPGNISPKLQLLDWKYSPMTCLPFIGNLKFLVELSMVNSKLEKLWEGTKRLENLKWMDLSGSKYLKELPNLSTATNLEKLDLTECISLVKLPSSIEYAIRLQKLNLMGCSSLVELPSSVGNAPHLQKLDLTYCSSLVELPSSIWNATNIPTIILRGCSSLVNLTSSIVNVIHLEGLALDECSSLVKLPSSIGNATNLQDLNLSHCSSLVELPFSIGNATKLQNLDLSYCSSLVELPSSIGNLHRLTGINLEECTKLEVLPTNINLESLNELNLTNCSLLKCFPEISTNIKVLKLNGTAVEEVPLAIRSWTRLEELHMSYCENLKDLSHGLDKITDLHLTDPEIQELGPWVKGFSRLYGLQLSGCRKLVALPQLSDSLSVLEAINCVSLERLDCSFRNPNISLNFRNCFKLNQKARDLIIQTSTRNFSVLPGEEVPACFTYRASGSSLIVKLNENTSTKFKACILVVNKGEDEVHDGNFLSVECRITSKQNARTSCRLYGTCVQNFVSQHLCIFDFEAAEVISTELFFEFKIQSYSTTWKIKECGIIQVLELSKCVTNLQ